MTSLVLEEKGSLKSLLTSKLPSKWAFALNDVPSLVVPNLLPKTVVNKVLTSDNNGVSSIPEVTPSTGH